MFIYFEKVLFYFVYLKKKVCLLLKSVWLFLYLFFVYVLLESIVWFICMFICVLLFVYILQESVCLLCTVSLCCLFVYLLFVYL